MPMTPCLQGNSYVVTQEVICIKALRSRLGRTEIERCSNLRLPFPCDIVRVDCYKARVATAWTSNGVGHQCMTQVCEMERTTCSKAEEVWG